MWIIRATLVLAFVIAILERQGVIRAPIPPGWPTLLTIIVWGFAQLALTIRIAKRARRRR